MRVRVELEKGKDTSHQPPHLTHHTSPTTPHPPHLTHHTFPTTPHPPPTTHSSQVGGSSGEDGLSKAPSNLNLPGHGPSSNGKSVAYLKYLKPTLGDGGDVESVSLLATQTDPSLGYRDLTTILTDIKNHVLANRIRYGMGYGVGAVRCALHVGVGRYVYPTLFKYLNCLALLSRF